MRITTNVTVRFQEEETIYRYYDPAKKEEGEGTELPDGAVVINTVSRKRYQVSYSVPKKIIKKNGALISKKEVELE